MNRERGRRFADELGREGAQFAVIGLGRFGRAVARGLAEAGAEVVALDKRMGRVEEIKDEVAYAAQCDATEVEALKAQGVHEMDAVVIALGSHFEAVLLIAVELMDLGAGHLIARASSSRGRRVMESVGIDHVISPEEEMGYHTAKLLSRPGLVDYFALSGDYDVEEVEVPGRLVGQRLGALDLTGTYGVSLITIRRPEESGDGGGGEGASQQQRPDLDEGEDEANPEEEDTRATYVVGVPEEDTVLQEGDALVVFGKPDDIERMTREED